MAQFIYHDALGRYGSVGNFVDVGTLSPTVMGTETLTLSDAGGDTITLTGTGFTYGLGGVTGGLVTGIMAKTHDLQSLMDIDQFSVSAATLAVKIKVEGLKAAFTWLGSGSDLMTGSALGDRLDGYGGKDFLQGNDGADRLFGGAGNDTLMGGNQADLLDGGANNDSLDGGAGIDVLKGGLGNDTETGGLGFDRFVFHAGDGADVITDFKAASADVGHLLQDHIITSQEMVDHFEKHLVRDGMTNAVLGVEVDFFDAGHVAQGSIFLSGIKVLAAITVDDFLIG